MCRWNGELYVFTIHFLLAIIQILHTIISFLFKFTILSNFSIYFLRSILLVPPHSFTLACTSHSPVHKKNAILMLLSPKNNNKKKISYEWVRKIEIGNWTWHNFFINRLTSLLLCTSVNIIFSSRISLSYIHTQNKTSS